MNNKALEWSLNKKEFWTCATQINLIEAMMVKLWYFPIYAEYVVKHLDELNMNHLRRMLRLLDPTAPCLRPFARTLQNADDSSYENVHCTSVTGFFFIKYLFSQKIISNLVLYCTTGRVSIDFYIGKISRTVLTDFAR